MSAREARIQQLYRQRPRQPFVTGSVVMLVAVMAISWLAGNFEPGRLVSPRQQANAARFINELQPWPLQQESAPADLGGRLQVAGQWFTSLWVEKGAEAVATTLAISLVAILLAGLWGGLLSLPAARNFATPHPFLKTERPAPRTARWLWRLVYIVARGGLAVVRAVPEYLWAFLLLALFGPSVWPMILALALHNAGILGKLTAEVIENVDTRAPAALRGLGASRLTIVGAALVPLSLPRFLLYFFYRWETCIRESTVLGMLGMASLGFWIVDARARNTYDEMAFFIICGLILVLLGDLVSAVVRHFLRRA